jgi:hypothetical protein
MAILIWFLIGWLLMGALLALARMLFHWPIAVMWLAIGLLFLLGGCGGKPELPKPSGSWEHMNADKQLADQNDITTAPPVSGRR